MTDTPDRPRSLRLDEQAVIPASALPVPDGWNPFAPINYALDETIYRKTRLGAGEWAWVRVASEDATAGELMNDAVTTPQRCGDVVRFTLDERGFAIAADGEG